MAAIGTLNPFSVTQRIQRLYDEVYIIANNLQVIVLTVISCFDSLPNNKVFLTESIYRGQDKFN